MRLPISKPLAVLFITLIVIATYWRIPSFDFVNLDDQAHIEQNKALKEFDLLHIWAHEHKDMFIPIFYTTLALEALISPSTPRFHPPNPHVTNLDPFIFHTASLMLHLANTILLYYLLFEFGWQTWLAVGGALFYSLHPLQTEVVAWISAQKDLTSSFFVLCTLLFFQRVVTQRPTPTLADKIKLLALVLSSLLAKPTTVFLAPLLVFWWCGVAHKKFRAGAGLLLPTIIACFVFALVTSGQQPEQSLPFQINLLEKIWVSLDTITFYLQKLFWPVHLAIDYGRNPPAFLQSPERYWTWLPAATLLFVIYRYWHKLGVTVRLGLALIFLSLLPVLGLKGFVYQNISTVSDRYMSVPLIGIAILITHALHTWLALKRPAIGKMSGSNARGIGTQGLTKREVAARGLTALLIGIFAFLNGQQSTRWKNVDTLWSHTLEVNPKSWFAYNNWAAHYEKINSRPRAIELYEKTLALKPDSMVHTRVGILYYDEGDRSLALRHFQEAVKLDPNNSVALQNLQYLSH